MMRRARLAAVCAVTAMAGVVTSAHAVSAATCAGTPLTGANAGKYGIATRAQLEDINDSAESRDCSYLQTADINLSGKEWTPIGGGLDGPTNRWGWEWTGKGTTFTGTYDGGGHTISGLTIDKDIRGAGLFGTINGAKIMNIRVQGSVKAFKSVGGLVGIAFHSVIFNAHSEVVVDTRDYNGGNGARSVGGLVGFSEFGNISYSSATGDVHADNASFVGGLAGETEDSVVSKSYATGNVTAASTVGGLVGWGYHILLEYSYATGDVAMTNGSGAGGLLGGLCSGDVLDSYSRGDVRYTGSYNGYWYPDLGGSIGESYDGEVRHVYSTGKVHKSDTTYSYGFVGATWIGNAGGAKFTNSFWNPTDAGVDGDLAATESTQTAMKDINLYDDAGWTIVDGWIEFDPTNTVWAMCDGVNDGYPYLLWSYKTTPCKGPDGISGTPDDIESTLADVKNSGTGTPHSSVRGVTGSVSLSQSRALKLSPQSDEALPETGSSSMVLTMSAFVLLGIGLFTTRLTRRKRHTA